MDTTLGLEEFTVNLNTLNGALGPLGYVIAVPFTNKECGEIIVDYLGHYTIL